MNLVKRRLTEDSSKFSHSPLWKNDTCSYREIIDIKNLTGKVIYFIDQCGSLKEIPPLGQVHKNCPSSELIVQIIVQNYDGPIKRNLDRSVKPNDGNKFLTGICELTLEELNRSFLYVLELNLVFGLNRDDLLHIHPKSDSYIEKTILDMVELRLSASSRSPMKLEINDPYARINKLFLVWATNISRFEVHRNDILPEFCKITFINEIGNEEIYKFDLSDILNSKGGIFVDELDMLITTSKQQAVNRKYYNEINYNRESVSAGEYDKQLNGVVEEYKRQIQILKQQMDNVESELKFYKLRDATEKKNAYDYIKMKQAEEKLYADERTARMNREAEELKFEKEKISAESSKTSDQLKIVGAVIGLCVIVVTAYVKIKSSK